MIEKKFNAKIWLYPGEGGWHFANLPQDLSEEIKIHDLVDIILIFEQF